MTREQLEEYRSKKDELAELTYKLQHLGENDEMVGNSVINDYRSGYPVPQSVVGVDWEKHDKTKDRYTSRISKLRQECDEVEKYVEEIEESLIRRIFRMYYIDGISQRDVASAVHLSQAAVSKKISDFLKMEYKK